MLQSSEAQAEPQSQPRATIASGLLLTVVAWFCSRLVVGAWGPARNPFSPTLAQWSHWDSVNYLAISVYGRTFGACGSRAFPASAFTRYLHLRWCGTAQWLPGYPWLIRATHTTGYATTDAAVVISWVALASAMFLVWFGWGRDLSVGRAFVLLLLFGLFPGAVYNFALFPTSLALAFEIGALLCAARARLLPAALLMTLAGLCYPTAWCAAIALVIGLAIMAIPLGRAMIVRRALWGVAGLGSLVVLGVHDQLAFHHFDAFFLAVDQRRARPSGFPGLDFLRLIFTQNTIAQDSIGSFSGAILAAQALLAIALVIAAAAVTRSWWRRKERDPMQLYPALTGVIVAASLVVVSTGGAWNRSIVLAAPCVVCLRKAPLLLLCAIIVAAGTCAALIAHPFFENLLV